MSFNETVLQRIYRDYSKDEAIQYLKDEMKKISFEKGIFVSELDEAKHEIEMLKKENQELKQLIDKKKTALEREQRICKNRIEKYQELIYKISNKQRNLC